MTDTLVECVWTDLWGVYVGFVCVRVCECLCVCVCVIVCSRG